MKMNDRQYGILTGVFIGILAVMGSAFLLAATGQKINYGLILPSIQMYNADHSPAYSAIIDDVRTTAGSGTDSQLYTAQATEELVRDTMAVFPGTTNITTIGTISTGTLPWANLSKTSSSLADLATKSAGALDSGNLDINRMPASGTWAPSGDIKVDTTTSADSPALWIDFTAHSIRAHGGVRLPRVPSSADVNTLDAYEEGTFTPTLTCASPGSLSVSYYVATGHYTRVGNRIDFNLYMVWDMTIGTATGVVQVAGLPAAAATSSNRGWSICAVRNDAGITTLQAATRWVQATTVPTYSYLVIEEYSAGARYQTLIGAMSASSGALNISGTYFTD